jgi:hypothetical protein
LPLVTSLLAAGPFIYSENYQFQVWVKFPHYLLNKALFLLFFDFIGFHKNISGQIFYFATTFPENICFTGAL